MDCDKNKLEYLTEFMRYYIYDNIVDILEDEKKEYSAVTLNNIIVCYLDFINELNNNKILSVRDFFSKLGFDDDDYINFENKRVAESAYYQGKQF